MFVNFFCFRHTSHRSPKVSSNEASLFLMFYFHYTSQFVHLKFLAVRHLCLFLMFFLSLYKSIRSPKVPSSEASLFVSHVLLSLYKSICSPKVPISEASLLLMFYFHYTSQFLHLKFPAVRHLCFSCFTFTIQVNSFT